MTNVQFKNQNYIIGSGSNKQLYSKYLKNKICWKTKTNENLTKKFKHTKPKSSQCNMSQIGNTKILTPIKKKIRITNTVSASRLQSNGNNNCQ